MTERVVLSVARVLAWLGATAIVILSVVPAADRPVTGAGHAPEHFAAFALVAATFAVGYRFSLAKSLVVSLAFCAGIELLQTPLPTRHARLSDFIVDLATAWLVIAAIRIWFSLFPAAPSNDGKNEYQ
ncbi:MAG: VanZ family protein [Gammaproteobacteria bacterium]